MPIFGSDRITLLPNAKDHKERKLQATGVPGIYVGTFASNSVVHLIWTNFERPYERMKIMEFCNISFNYEFTHMHRAESAMSAVSQDLAVESDPKAPVPAQYTNIIVSVPRHNASKSRKESRVPGILEVESGPPLHAPQFTEEQRETILKEIETREPLRFSIDQLTAGQQGLTQRIEDVTKDQGDIQTKVETLASAKRRVVTRRRL